MKANTLSPVRLHQMDAYWRAANYLSVGQIYLYDNPLLKQPLALEHIKPRLLGHWGTTPGLNFLYVHLNRVIKEYDLSVIYITGPGHGGPGLVAHAYLEGTYTEVYPSISQDADGMQRLFKQFSFPGGIPSHVAPETPGSIHEGGELGYSLSHAYGAAFDNPDLLVACVVGDGEAETVRRLFTQLGETFSSLDILVNNAGVYKPMQLEEFTEDEFHREFNTNVLGPLLAIRESLNYFGPSGGSVINVGSGASRMCPPGYSIYAASKSALDAITGVLAKELAPRNIRVNSVNPGATLSEGTMSAGLYGAGSEFERKLVDMTPLGRIGKPSDIAKIVAFLASEDSGWLTGEVIQASGGLR